MTFTDIEQYTKKYKEQDTKNAEWIACICYTMAKLIKASAYDTANMYFAGYLYIAKNSSMRQLKKLADANLLNLLQDMSLQEAQLVNSAYTYVNLRKKHDSAKALATLKDDIIPKHYNILTKALKEESLYDGLE